MDYFVRTGALTGWPELVIERGQNPNRLLRELDLGVAVLHNPDLYLPYTAVADLLTLSAKRCDSPDFGVLLGARQGLEVVGALGSTMCLQSTVGDALRLMQKNLDFHARGVRVDVEVGGEFTEIRMRYEFLQQTNCDQLVALSLALLAQGVAQLHARAAWPNEAELSIQAKDSNGSYAQALHCPVDFDAAENRLRYPARLLGMPVQVEESLRTRLSHQWRGDWQQGKPISLSQEVERAIAALLPTGECNISMVAKLVDMHPRSLQIRLQENSSSFAQLLRTTRLRLACQYLKNSDMSLTTLAMNLGFAELAVFSRAFKQWTGKSPRAWRQQANSL